MFLFCPYTSQNTDCKFISTIENGGCSSIRGCVSNRANMVPKSLADCLNSDQDPVRQKSRMPKLVNKSLFMEYTEHYKIIC